LDSLELELRQSTTHPLAGPPSLHASLLQGGTEISVYAAESTLKLERRTIPGESVAGTEAELAAIIEGLAADDESFKAGLRPLFDRPPFEVGPEALIVDKLDRALEAVVGRKGPHVGATFWTDAAIFAAAGMETVLLGPVGAGLHSAVEWVDVASLNDLAAVLTAVCQEYCG
jgi:acetylornithine deacetylase